jgi:hypothetical protein
VLAANSSCTFTLTFTPTVTGVRYGSITITDNDAASPQVLNLTGEGWQTSESPASLSFGSIPIGTSSAPQTVSIANQGKTVLDISSVNIQDNSFHNSPNYTQTSTCGSSLNPGKNCKFTVTFTPTVKGNLSGVLLVFTSDPATSPVSISLSGSGTQ